jgi:hypothetical protein
MPNSSHVSEFSFNHFRFHLEPRAPLRMPAYNKGNVIRGGFGSTFRRIVCHANCREPETCELRNVCPYTAVFNPFVPEGSEKLSLNRDIPRPFIIKPPLQIKETYSPGERLTFDFVLVGKAKDYLPYFIVTFKELSQAGLGRRRAPVDLVGVESIDANGESVSVYTGANNLVQPPGEFISWESLTGGNNNGNGFGNVQRVSLEFLTPTMLKADGLVIRKPTFSTIIKRLRDRINALAYFYCGQGLDIDFKMLGESADGIDIARDSTRWIDSARFSRRRGVSHDLSGFVGEISFEGDLAQFMPYLKLGEYVHVGKNAVFGNGWYRITEVG